MGGAAVAAAAEAIVLEPLLKRPHDRTRLQQNTRPHTLFPMLIIDKTPTDGSSGPPRRYWNPATCAFVAGQLRISNAGRTLTSLAHSVARPRMGPGATGRRQSRIPPPRFDTSSLRSTRSSIAPPITIRRSIS